LRDRALADLETLGLSPSFIERLATVHHVEVELHRWNAADESANQIHEAAAAFPWEYLLSASTRGAGRFQPILISRLIRNGGRPVVPPSPSRVLFVESAPGRLYEQYDFASERTRIAAAIRVQKEIMPGGERREPPVHFTASPEGNIRRPREMRLALTETEQRLRDTVSDEPWDAIHVSGIDTHQAAALVPGFYKEIQEKPVVWDRIRSQLASPSLIASPWPARRRRL
jgi:hypothetical protein